MLQSVLDARKRAMLEVMYDVPSVDNIAEVVINEECISQGKTPVVVFRSEEEKKAAS